MTHNHIRDTRANLLGEVCHDVKVECQKVNEGDCLNPKTIIGYQAQLDISARRVWTPFDKTVLDIRVSHPNCLSNRTKTLKEVYEKRNKKNSIFYLKIQLIIIYINQALHFSHAKLE